MNNKDKKMFRLVRQSNGQPSWSITIVWLMTIFCLVAITLGLLQEITIGTFTLRIRMIDPTTVLALLGPSYSLYGWRRLTDARYGEFSEGPVSVSYNTSILSKDKPNQP